MATEMKFEEALKKLEEIVRSLEDGDLPLDESLEKYEEGIRLSKICAKRLEAAKKKVEVLLKSEDGSFELKAFDEAAGGGEPPAREPRTKKKAKDEGLY